MLPVWNLALPAPIQRRQAVHPNPTPVASPLAKLTSLVTGGGLDATVEGTEVIRPVPLGDITATEVAAPARAKTAKTTPTSAAAPSVPAVVVNGEDLSDYID